MNSIFDKQTIGDLILTYRKKHHMRRENLANRLGVCPETVHNWENGTVPPSLKSMMKLSDEKGISFQEIYKIIKS